MNQLSEFKKGTISADKSDKYVERRGVITLVPRKASPTFRIELAEGLFEDTAGSMQKKPVRTNPTADQPVEVNGSKAVAAIAVAVGAVATGLLIHYLFGRRD